MSDQIHAIAEPFPFSAEQICSRYIALRDTVKLLNERHAAQLAPYKAAMETLEGEAGRMMRAMKTTLSTNAGSAFWVPQESYKVVDVEAFRAFMLANNEWRMGTAHCSKDGIRAWREEQKRPADWPADVEWNPPIPPGVSYDFDMVVQFRKG
jgi:hypothetical protein